MSRYSGMRRVSTARWHVEKFIGDAVMAYSDPQVHEDDALRAVRAAAEMRERLATLNEEFERQLERDRGAHGRQHRRGRRGRRLRGAGIRDRGRRQRRRPPRAGRRPGEILLAGHSPAHRGGGRAEPVDSLELKGKAQAVEAWRLQEVLPRAPAFTRRIDAPFVGRDRGARAVAWLLRSHGARRPVSW